MLATPLPDSTFRPLKSIFTIVHLVTFAVIYQVAPDPYIDEIFHVPQAQAYCRGDWFHWNNKITTPPGLYLVSSAIYKLGTLIPVPFNLCSTLALRSLNFFIVVFIAPKLTRSLYRHIHPSASEDALLFAELLPAFPLLSFFGNLYYTDVLSTTAILWSYLLAIKRRYVSSAMVLTPSISFALLYILKQWS
jgi:alpha-1,2-glucosyltransferase